MMGRIPACSTQSFDGGSTTSGHVSGYVENNTASILIDQGFLGGNRIGHSPFNPKQFIPSKNHKRAPSLLEIIKEFSSSYFETKVYQGLYHHLDKSGNVGRQIRSEFREMISMGCSILTHYYNVMTGEIGFRNDKGKYIRFSYQQLADKLSVSLIRVKRFFKFLKGRGLVTILEDKKKDADGNWKSNVSRKIINPKFFIDTLGISAWKKISNYKDWMIKKFKPKTKQQSDNVSMLKNILNSTNRKSISEQKKPTRDVSEKLFVENALLLYEKDPSKSLSDYLKELKSRS